MAILDPPFSILDIANARTSPLSLFEQSANTVFQHSASQLGRIHRKIEVSQKRDLLFLSKLLGVILFP
jgi:hypothetical protein